MQQFFAVLIVLLALWGAVLFLRRKGMAVLKAPLLARKQAASIQQLDRMRLSPQHSIHLLQIEGRKLLIAVHGQGITVLENSDSRQGYLAGGSAASSRGAGR